MMVKSINLVDEYLDLMERIMKEGTIAISFFPKMKDLNDSIKFNIESQQIAMIFQWFKGDKDKIYQEIETRHLSETLKLLNNTMKHILKKQFNKEILDEDFSLTPP